MPVPTTTDTTQDERTVPTTGRQSAFGDAVVPVGDRQDLIADNRPDTSAFASTRPEVRNALNPTEMQKLRDLENLSESARHFLSEAFDRDVFRNNPERMAEVVNNLHEILENEGELANSSLNGTGQAESIIVSSLQAIADYGSIHQGLTSNCTMTTFSAKACRECPWDYTRVVSELVVDGQTELSPGQTMQIYSGSFDVDSSREQQGFHERTLSNRIFQDSAMEFCHNIAIDGLVEEGDWTYNAAKMAAERRVGGRVVESQAGLYPPQFQAFYQAMFRVEADRVDSQNLLGPDSQALTGAELLSLVDATAQRTGQAVPIEIRLGENHEVLYEKTVTDSQGNEYVIVRNPWESMGDISVAGRTIGYDENGRFEIYRKEDFEQILLSGLIDKNIPADQVDVTRVTEMGDRMNVPAHETNIDGIRHVIVHTQLLSNNTVEPDPNRNDTPILDDLKDKDVEKSSETGLPLLSEDTKNGPEPLVWYTESQARARNFNYNNDEDDILSFL